jgi:hypothetical protein
MTGLDKLWAESVGSRGSLATVAAMSQRGPATEAKSSK